jgi:ketosteroid isomerase-like protein
MRIPSAVITVILIASSCAGTRSVSSGDTEALYATGFGIRGAYAKGDTAAILRYHHPEVIKALSFTTILKGRKAVAEDLARNAELFHLEFTEHKVESLLIQKETAVETSVFTLKGTPKGEGESFIFRGRSQVVYVRHKHSPSGWACIREIVQGN